MYLADCHTHTNLSFDSQADPLAIVRAARAVGLSQLCFTDHVDFLDENGVFTPLTGPEGRYQPPAWAQAQRDGDFTLRVGIELGEAWEDPEAAQAAYRWPGLDFVLGSVHNLDSAHGGTDLYHIQFQNEDICRQVLDNYFLCMERLAALNCFDSLAHVIYPLRYMNARDGNRVSLAPWLDQLARIFKTVLSNGRTLEVNTNRGQTVEDWRETLGLWRDCGGAFATLGSDAHTPQDVGKGIPQAAALLKSFGLDLAVYENHQPQLVKL